MLRRIKQYKHPKEFRIKNNRLREKGVEELYQLVAKAYGQHQYVLQSSQKDNHDKFDTDKALIKCIVELSIIIWRMQKKISNLESIKENESEFRWLFRLVNNGLDALNQNGIEISDHNNELNTGGEAYSVIAYQAEKGLSEERVIETIEPSIYYNDKLIKRGEVIVGRPEEV